MSSVNESIVREFFESLGYLTSQPRKYMIPGRQKEAGEEVDIIVFNPSVPEHMVPEHMVWTVKDLKNIARAVVAIRGWHTERFYASTLEQTPEILRFTEAGSLRAAEKLLGSSSMAKVLCLPKLAASGELKSKTIKILRERGVDGVISFQTMLQALLTHVDTNKNYEKSDLLQIIRILKNYDFIKDNQLDLFTKKRHKKTTAKKTPDTL